MKILNIDCVREPIVIFSDMVHLCNDSFPIRKLDSYIQQKLERNPDYFERLEEKIKQVILFAHQRNIGNRDLELELDLNLYPPIVARAVLSSTQNKSMLREQLKNKANILFLKRNPALTWGIIEDYLFFLFSTRNILRIFEELKAFNVPELTELVAEKIPTSLIDECLSKQVVLEGFGQNLNLTHSQMHRLIQGEYVDACAMLARRSDLPTDVFEALALIPSKKVIDNLKHSNMMTPVAFEELLMAWGENAIAPHYIEQFIQKSFVDEHIQFIIAKNQESGSQNFPFFDVIAKFPARLLDEEHAQLIAQCGIIPITQNLVQYTPFESIMYQIGLHALQDDVTELAQNAVMNGLSKNPNLTDKVIRDIIQVGGILKLPIFSPLLFAIKDVNYIKEIYNIDTYYHGQICRELIRNPNLPDDMLIDIAKENPHLLKSIVKRILSPKLMHSDIAKQIALNIDFQGGYVDILRSVAQKLSNKTPFPDVMLKLLKETKLSYLELIKNPHIPIDIELKLAKMKSETTLTTLAKWTTHEEVMRALLNKSYEVCFALSCNPFVPPFILEQLIDEDDLSLCESIAKHHNIDENVVIHLERMQSDIINRALNSNPSYITLDNEDLYLEDL